MEALQSGKLGFELLIDYPHLKQLMHPSAKSDDSDDDTEDGGQGEEELERPVNTARLQSVVLAKLFLSSLSIKQLAEVPEGYELAIQSYSSPARSLLSSPASSEVATPPNKGVTAFGTPIGLSKRRSEEEAIVNRRQVESELRQLKKRAQSDEVRSPATHALLQRQSSLDETIMDDPLRLSEETSKNLDRSLLIRSHPFELETHEGASKAKARSERSPSSSDRRKTQAKDELEHLNTPPGSPNKQQPAAEDVLKGSDSPMRSLAKQASSEDLETSVKKSDRVVVLKTKKKKKATAFLERQSADYLSREAKRETLMELVAFIKAEGYSLLADQNIFFRAAMDMICRNLFRRFAPPPLGRKFGELDWDDDTPVLDPRWPHLSVVYELFNRLVAIKSFSKSLLSASFCAELVSLFQTEDPRERDSLKTSLHRVYGTFPAMRPAIRKEIQGTLERSVNERKRHSGIAELLEVVGSICSGFVVPLKKEHSDFLKFGLLPLHRSDGIGTFHNQLCYCLSQYVEKDATVLLQIVRALRRYFPLNAAQKQLLFLNELEETFEIALRADTTLLGSHALRRLLSEADLSSLFDDAVSIVEDALLSEHFQVCERALFLWNNDYFTNHLFKASAPRMRGVLVAVEKDRAHWNPTVRKLAEEVAFLYSGDTSYKEAVGGAGSLRSSTLERKRRTDAVLRAKMWEDMAKAASARQVGKPT